MNKVIIMGNLGADPAFYQFSTGNSKAVLSVATNENWTDKNGEKKTRTEWHSITCWGKLGELCSQHLKKGSKVLIEGKLRTEKFEDKNGAQKESVVVDAQHIQFLDKNS